MHLYKLTYTLYDFEVTRMFKSEPANRFEYLLCVAASGAHIVELIDITN